MPTVRDELGREMVEQLWVGWSVALRTEVVGGIDDAFAEMVFPDAVYHDPGNERACAVFLVGHPFTEGDTWVCFVGLYPV
jgi:hypothetical protein